MAQRLVLLAKLELLPQVGAVGDHLIGRGVAVADKHVLPLLGLVLTGKTYERTLEFIEAARKRAGAVPILVGGGVTRENSQKPRGRLTASSSALR